MLHTVCNVRQNVRVMLWILIGRKKIVEFWLVCCFLLSISTSGHLFQLVWLERGLLCSRILKWPWRVFLCVSILQANLLHSEKLYKNYCNSNLTYKSATQNCDIFSGRWNFSPNNIAAFFKLCECEVAILRTSIEMLHFYLSCKILHFLHFHKRDDNIFLSMERKVRNPQSHIYSYAWIKWSYLLRHYLLRNRL